MRPLRLVMQAFGPYAGRQILDFEDLQGRRFFLIHGPTGSGKTTVLDAMVFALYGDTSGAEREPDHMRSHHAQADSLTEVLFDFAVGTDAYRIWRRPAQERPKHRGDGTTLQAHQATIWRLDQTRPACGDGLPTTGAPLAAGWSKVTAKATTILGFRDEQFRQVVVLPQGRFQELLRADSVKREEILATLFATQYYARIERELKEDARTLHRQLENIAQESSFLLQSTELAETADMTAARAQLADLWSEACERQARHDELRTEAEAALASAKQDHLRLDTAEQAACELAELRAETPQVSADRLRLATSRRAALTHGARENRDLRNAEAAAAQRRLGEATERVAIAESAQSAAAETLAQEEAREQDRRAAGDRVARLSGLAPRLQELEQACSVRELAEQDAERAGTDLEQAVAALAAAEAAKEKAAAAHEAAARSAAALDLVELAAQQAVHMAERRGRLDDVRRELRVAREQTGQADEASCSLRTGIETAAEHLRKLEQDWHSGQAAALAATLQPGRPCPVCGSTDHPAPAAADLPLVDRADLELARQRVADLADAGRDAQAAHIRAASAAEALAAEEAQLLELLAARVASSAEECRAEARTAEATLHEAQAAAGSVHELAQELRAAADRAARASAALDEARERRGLAEAALTAAQTACDERSRAIPAGIADTSTLESELQTALRESDRLEEQLRAAAEAAAAANLALAEARTERSAAAQAAAQAAEAAAAASQALERALVEQGFVDANGAPDEIECAAAGLAPADAEALQGSITVFDRRLADAEAAARHATAQAAGLQRHDLAALQSAADETRAAAQQAATAAAELSLRLEQLDRAGDRLAALERERSGLEERYAITGRLSRLANGENQAGLTFQRFVLGALLDAVLITASDRLRAMSQDRYQLIRTDEKRGGRRTAGLDLDVFDAWSGRQRPVATLSGGESFLAALSLALGLAETVQARSGGVHLDTIFVDEGFGMLDDDALDLAISTLVGLQAGDRLVGIISHVAELRERVDARLEIVSDRGISTARFIVS